MRNVELMSNYTKEGFNSLFIRVAHRLIGRMGWDTRSRIRNITDINIGIKNIIKCSLIFFSLFAYTFVCQNFTFKFGKISKCWAVPKYVSESVQSV